MHTTTHITTIMVLPLPPQTAMRPHTSTPWPHPAPSTHTPCAGYISGLLPPGAEPDLDAAVQQGWPADVHVIGKDILRFHAVYWPAMLMSAGLPLPGKVFGHGFLTKDGFKMGKSMGNVLEPTTLVQAYGPDAVRFYFMKEISFG